jgi:hypothetical protein
MKKTIMLFVLSLLTLVAGCPQTNTEQKADLIYSVQKALFYQEVFEKPFSPELLWAALIFEDIKSPEIVYKQAQLETGNFTSELFIKANNLFGMKLPHVRDTYADGEYNYHAYYKTWISCVKDYKLFQEYYASQSYDLTDYLSFLKDMGYATDKKYLSKLGEIS